MTVLVGDHDSLLSHDPGEGHPESPRRLLAVRRGIALSGVGEGAIVFAPRRARREEIETVHEPSYVSLVKEISDGGGGRLDADTVLSTGSYRASLKAAGSGLDAIERLRNNEGSAAFLAVRPPGHHARRASGSGFCLFNSAAIACAALKEAGERVVLLDLDAHHGNGSQEIFYETAEVLYVSIHQSPFYPGTGDIGEVGAGSGKGATINIPVPQGTAGDLYRRVFDELIVPSVELFSPSWLVVSAGFDAHRDDPLTDLGLSSGDFFDLTVRAMRLVLPGRRLFFLEGGYDEEALALCSGATVAALCGERFVPERQTSGSLYGTVPRIGSQIVDQALRLNADALNESSGSTGRYGAQP